MNWKDSIDYPISHDHYRALCEMHGEQVPPKLGNLYLPSEEEYKQQFIEWQNKQRELYLRGKPRPTSAILKPIPIHAPPALKRLKAIDV